MFWVPSTHKTLWGFFNLNISLNSLKLNKAFKIFLQNNSKVAAHDIAIIKLESPLEFNEWVQPAKLPKQNSVQEGQATLSGWGSVSKRYLPKLPKYLQYADIPIVSFEACQAVFQKENANVKLEKTMLCTGPLGGSVSACSVSYFSYFLKFGRRNFFNNHSFTSIIFVI